MELKQCVDKFYYDMSLYELKNFNINNTRLNITYNSIMYMDLISYKEKCTVSFLAEALNISKSAVTIKINELINRGLVIKTQSKEDKRINYLTLSPKVVEEYQIYDTFLQETLNRIRDKYSQAQIDTFCEMLNLIGDSFVSKTRTER